MKNRLIDISRRGEQSPVSWSFEFWSSQGHVTSIEANHILRPEQVWLQ